ncbi:MAG: hypothetical protein U1F60_01925 [Planctomycetota bacterium]
MIPSPAFVARTLCPFLPLLLVSTPLLAQQAPAGYETTSTPLPAGASAVLQTPSGIVLCTGTELQLHASGQPAQTLLSLPSFAFGSFTIPVGSQHVLFGENTTNRLWLVPLAGPAPSSPLATVTFNYDAVLLTPQTALLSAKLGGFATPDNDLVALDLTNGSWTSIASLPGASGPLALLDNGDVLYATSSLAFPTPPGTAELLRFPRATIDQAIANQTVLGPNSATVVLGGLDAASDLAVDDDGDVFYVDWMQNNVREIHDVGSSQALLGAPLLGYVGTPVSPAALQFVPGAGIGVFEPFQPRNGTLLVHATDFGSTNQLSSVVAAEAAVALSGPSPLPSGPFSFDVSGGPANGMALLVFDLQSPVGPMPMFLGGYEQPLWWEAALLGSTTVEVLAQLDGTGAISLASTNPGLVGLPSALVQVGFVSTDGVLGATAPRAFLVGP